MYIYLDKQGVVKEIINDEALRQSASNVNEIYVYCDGLQESDIGSVLATYGLPDGTITDEMQVATQTEEWEIPYDAERDLKYFQYYKAYPFYHFAIADLALSQEGVVRLMLRLAQKDGEYIKVAGLICFDVEGELVKDDHGVSLAQYNYFVKVWMGTKECLPLDGSKAMRANLDMGAHSVVFNGKALKDNNGALNYNGSDLAKQKDVSSLQSDVSSLKADNTKNKSDIASLKTDNVANKADISALKTDNTKNKENIVGLQNQIDTINATQNVVDIVGTKAELNAYSTKDLHANDKIEVLVDESQNNANTIYEWNGKAWSLVGSKAPYYSKAESDARYNELKAKSYDKDTTGYVTGHVPDSGMVKSSLDSISESVETLSLEVVKKNTDASLKSLTLPSASDLKTKDGSSIGGVDVLDWSSKTITTDGVTLTALEIEELKKHNKLKVNIAGFIIFTIDYVISEEDNSMLVTAPYTAQAGFGISGFVIKLENNVMSYSVLSIPDNIPDGFQIDVNILKLASGDGDNIYINTINDVPVLAKDGAHSIKVQKPLVSGTNIKTISGESVLGAGDIPVQSTLYHHVITLHNATNTAYFAFSMDGTWQDEITKDTLFNVLNAYVVVGTGVVQYMLLDKISFRNTAEKTKVHQYANFRAGGYVNAEATFASVFGTDYTLEDVTYPLK